MNPYPLVGLNHFTVPVAIVRLLALCARVSHRAYHPILSPRVLGNDLRAAQTRELSKADRKPGTVTFTIDAEMGQCCWRAGAVDRSGNVLTHVSAAGAVATIEPGRKQRH